VLRSSLACPELIRRVLCFLEERMSEESAVQGVMVEVYGMGVLLSGVTGIGKSECALALIRNGHRLIADDRVRVRKRSESIIVAFADGTTRHHIEVRGVGIVDVKSIFGVGSVRDAIKIDLVVELEMWSKAKEYDRLGIDEKYASILGVNIPKITIPVMPGRNLAVIVEIAVMNLRLRKQGFSAIKELDRRLIRITRKKDR